MLWVLNKIAPDLYNPVRMSEINAFQWRHIFDTSTLISFLHLRRLSIFREEFKRVFHELYSNKKDLQTHALGRIEVWKSRYHNFLSLSYIWMYLLKTLAKGEVTSHCTGDFGYNTTTMTERTIICTCNDGLSSFHSPKWDKCMK